jgi:patatin-related protein
MEPSTAPQTEPAPADGRPLFAPTREVRFAVVLYGGVSLAIYINGVAQELLRLVRATAPEKPFDGVEAAAAEEPLRALLTADEDAADPRQRLRGTEKVYRKLGLLPHGYPPQPDAPPTIRTRFVVDIISGTSAGGINGMFLAKALANNLSMDSLRDLWVQEGDITKLLNDRLSVLDLPGMKPHASPASLLNSRRMYYKILHALQGMDEDASGEPSPLVDELDLFMPTTDLAGLLTPIRLSDSVVFERRHRKVFPFRYSTDYAAGRTCNDFTAEVNPFLAYAARCTSSFAFAFEPMRLADIDEVLDLPAWSSLGLGRSDDEKWQRFYAEYLNAPDGGDAKARERRLKAQAQAFQQTAFGDGGFLDNKPFSHAIAAFQNRRADLPVERKLLYVEPSPQHPELEQPAAGRPNALETARKALFDLPNYETIREDIESVRGYNRLVQRVRTVLSGRDLDWGKAPLPTPSQQSFRLMDITEAIGRYGTGYGPYHRLRVASVTDELSRLVARLAGYDEESDERLAIRTLVGAWRTANYVPYHDGSRPTENEFVFRLDIWWRLRRLSFLMSRVDELHEEGLAVLNQRMESMIGRDEGAPGSVPADRHADFCRSLRVLKAGLGELFIRLRTTLRHLATPGPENPAARNLAGLAITRRDLREILEAPTDEVRQELAKRHLSQASSPLQAFAEAVAGTLSATLRTIGIAGEHLLGIPKRGTTPEILTGLIARAETLPEMGTARRILAHYYTHYEHYDLVTFPILYQTGAAEASEVDILRISPEDANDLFDEKTGTRRGSAEERRQGKNRIPAGRGKSKLAGVSLGHFGAFLVEDWRVGDIVWGRLDGAERILAALLPGKEQAGLRRDLLLEAQQEILAEELKPAQKKSLGEILRVLQAEARALPAGERDELLKSREQTALDRWMIAVTAPGMETRLQQALDAFLEPDRLEEAFIENTQGNRALVPEPTFLIAGRATQIVGKILESLADEYHSPGGVKRWIGMVAWLGRLFWGLVEISIPQQPWYFLVRHWLHLLLAFEIFLITAGLLLGREGATQLGWASFGITVGLYLFQYVFAGVLAGRVRRLAKAAGVLAVGGLTLYGGWTLWGQAQGWLKKDFRGLIIQAVGKHLPEAQSKSGG